MACCLSHSYVILNMKTREFYEDSIHDIISMILLNVEKSNIRPSYQKTKLANPFATNRMDAFDSMKDGVDAARNFTDIVYFWWHFDALDLLSTEVKSDGVTAVIPFRLTISVYGSNSMPNAIKLKAFFRTPDVFNSILNLNSVITSEPTLTTAPEEINEEWWERTDLDIKFETMITDFTNEVGAEPVLNSMGDSVGYSKSSLGLIDVGRG